MTEKDREMAFKVPNISAAACARRKAAVQPLLPRLGGDQIVSLVRGQHFLIDGAEPTQDLRDVLEMCVESGAIPVEAVEASLAAPRGEQGSTHHALA